MKLSIGLVFFVKVVFASSWSYQRLTKCSCVPLRDCPTTRQNSNRFNGDTNFRQKEQSQYDVCYYSSGVTYICCPTNIVEQFIPSSDVSNSFNTVSSNAIKLLPSTTTAPDTSPTSQTFFSTKKPKGMKKNIFECGRALNRNFQVGYNTELSDFPWLALLEYDTPDGKRLGCGGALIGEQHILTAARCLTSPSHNISGVVLGQYDTAPKRHCLPDSDLGKIVCRDSAVKVGVQEVIVHEKYNNGVEPRAAAPKYDIALVRLKNKVRLGAYVQPICLPLGRSTTRDYMVAGWGRSLIPESTGFAQKFTSRLTGMDLSECQANAQLPFVTDEHLCAGSTSQKELPCIADAGGPLMAYEVKNDGVPRLTIYGVTFMDLSCNKTETKTLPGVFTNLYDYVPWIIEKVNN